MLLLLLLGLWSLLLRLLLLLLLLLLVLLLVLLLLVSALALAVLLLVRVDEYEASDDIQRYDSKMAVAQKRQRQQHHRYRLGEAQLHPHRRQQLLQRLQQPAAICLLR